MTIKPSSAKGKGRRHQQWVRDKILDRFPKLEADDVRSTAMGQGGGDIQLSPAARKLFPYSVECKSNKSFAIYKIIEQAEANCPNGAEPIAVIKANRKHPLVVLSANHFFKLVGNKK